MINKKVSPDLSDISFTHWVDKYLPSRWRPYARLARLDRPVGTWLTLLPCLAALVQASGGLPSLANFVIFSFGTLMMRSAGSTINDLADRNFDAHVERTRFRPLANGDLTTQQGLWFLAAELLISASLLLFLNTYSQILALLLMPIVIAYPFCKRFTHWPQVPLGMAFNWGMLMTWSEVRNTVDAGAIVMWVGAIAWQVGYDTIYAYVDIKDDKQLKLRSTAILFGSKGKLWVAVFYLLAALGWVVGGVLLGMAPLYFLGAVVITIHLIWQVICLDLEKPDGSFKLFRANMMTGLLLLISSYLGTIELF